MIEDWRGPCLCNSYYRCCLRAGEPALWLRDESTPAILAIICRRIAPVIFS